VDQELARRRVLAARVARLATIDPDGRPHLAPIVFVLDRDTLYTAVDAKPKRSRTAPERASTWTLSTLSTCPRRGSLPVCLTSIGRFGPCPC
jgi:hypothetical protein